MRRGDVWWVEFPPPVGRRPAVLVSRNEAYPIRSAVSVIPLTRTIRNIPVEVPLGPEDGIRHRSAANADAVATVPKGRVLEYITTLAPAKVDALNAAIKFALDLP